MTGGVARQDRVAWNANQDRAAHTAEARLQYWEEGEREDGGDVGGDSKKSREGGGFGRKGERTASKTPRSEHRGGSGYGTSNSGCSPLIPPFPSPGTPQSEGSPLTSSPGALSSRAFRGARPATPWGPSRGEGLQRFSSHPHLPGLHAD